MKPLPLNTEELDLLLDALDTLTNRLLYFDSGDLPDEEVARHMRAIEALSARLRGQQH